MQPFPTPLGQDVTYSILDDIVGHRAEPPCSLRLRREDVGRPSVSLAAAGREPGPDPCSDPFPFALRGEHCSVSCARSPVFLWTLSTLLSSFLPKTISPAPYKPCRPSPLPSLLPFCRFSPQGPHLPPAQPSACPYPASPPHTPPPRTWKQHQ